MGGNERWIALRLELDDARFEFVVTQMQDRVVKLTRAAKHPGLGALAPGVRRNGRRAAPKGPIL